MNDYEMVLKILSDGGKEADHFFSILNRELSLPNIKMPTMGGEVFWTDYVNYNGWRLQQNDIFKNARILDSNDMRIAWGTLNGMYKVMDRLVNEARKYENLQPSFEDRMSSMEELKKLKELYDIEAITKEEYEQKKKSILSKI